MRTDPKGKFSLRGSHSLQSRTSLNSLEKSNETLWKKGVPEKHELLGIKKPRDIKDYSKYDR